MLRGSLSARWVYPRVCGGRPPRNIAPSPTATSAACRAPAVSSPRATPVHDSSLSRVYPRVCGGTSKHCRSRPDGRWSSVGPNVNKTLAASLRPSLVLAAPDVSRSIPACAGEPTLFVRRIRRQDRQTEALALLIDSAIVEGLSPRVRGNRIRDHACAQTSRVYPRVCGGTRYWSHEDQMRRGLSPRVRGNRHLPRSDFRLSGSIPACAGEPFGPRGCSDGFGVYPRVCGGTAPSPDDLSYFPGLSPRVRGNRL